MHGNARSADRFCPGAFSARDLRSASSIFGSYCDLSTFNIPIANSGFDSQADISVSSFRKQIPVIDSFADCCFIEDTIEFTKPNGDNAKRVIVVNKLKSPSRQGEEAAVHEAVLQLAKANPSSPLEIIELEKGHVDGGDVFFVGVAVLVGITTRTDPVGFESLKHTLEKHLGIPVYSVPVEHGLHLKTNCSLIDEGIIAIADNEAGKSIKHTIEAHVPVRFEYLVVPDGPASNVLRIDDNIVIQDGFPKSEAIIRAFAEKRGLQIHKLTMSEFIKADGRLTCCNVLLNV